MPCPADYSIPKPNHRETLGWFVWLLRSKRLWDVGSSEDLRLAALAFDRGRGGLMILGSLGVRGSEGLGGALGLLVFCRL